MCATQPRKDDIKQKASFYHIVEGIFYLVTTLLSKFLTRNCQEDGLNGTFKKFCTAKIAYLL